MAGQTQKEEGWAALVFTDKVWVHSSVIDEDVCLGDCVCFTVLC